MFDSISHWRRWFQNRPDREHEITINRQIISLAIFVYVWLIMPGFAEQTFEARMIALAYLCAASVLSIHLLARPGISVVRRVAAIGVDLGLLSIGLYAGGEYVTILYPFYYWIILGNGFRYGVRYLYFGTFVGALGFLLVTQSAEYWLQNQPLGLGLLGGVIILPLYAATLIRSLSQARELAEQANRAKTQFLASVSHELRTPLNAVVGMADLLNDTSLRADQREMVETVRTSSKALLALIDDLLDFASIEAGKITINSAPFHLSRMLSQVREVASLQAGAKGLRFHLHVTPRTPSFLLGDERRLREVLLNLIGNAVKFTEQGRVDLFVDGAPTRNLVSLRFDVSDTGIGIEASARRRIFERFTQADETILNRFGGTGLGLAISQHLVRLQGGEITVESVPGRGSTFSFTLTMALSDTQDEPEVDLQDVEVVLLGGDEDQLRWVEERLGQACGSVRKCEDVLQAARILKSPTAGQIQRRIVLLVGDRGLAVISSEGPLKLAEIEAANPYGVFLVGAPSMDATQPVIRKSVSAVLSRDALLSDLTAAMRFVRGGQATVAVRQPLIRRRERSLRILLADDNRVNQKVISRILEAGGHEVSLVEDGEQALDSLERHSFDLVVMDLNMPVMDGIEATKLYRMASLGERYVPIVGLTADATPSAALRAKEAGMDACLTKPVSAPVLLDRIDELTAGQPQAQPVQVPEATQVAPHLGSHDLVDFGMLENLKILGGETFLEEVISAFLTDGGVILDQLQSAVDRGDVPGFNEQVHALQSGSGNVGVHGLAERCRRWRPKSASDLKNHGGEIVSGLRSDFEAARSIFLRDYVSKPFLIIDRRPSDEH